MILQTVEKSRATQFLCIAGVDDDRDAKSHGEKNWKFTIPLKNMQNPKEQEIVFDTFYGYSGLWKMSKDKHEKF